MSIKIEHLNYVYSEGTAWRFHMENLWGSSDIQVPESLR